MKRLFLTAAASALLSLGAGLPAFAEGDHVITMQQADIRAFIDDVAMVTGRTFLVDPRVQGKVTISSEQSLSPSEVFAVFKDVMRVHGYTLIRTSSGAYRITLIQGAAQDAPFVQNTGFNSQFATTVVKLNQSDASDVAKLVKPVMNAQGILTANTGGKVIVITDYPENLNKAREIIAAVDVSDSVMETISFENISANDAAEAIKNIAGARASYQVVAVPNTNSIILDGPAADIARIRPILRDMDASGRSEPSPVSVVALRFADGAELIELLGTLLPAYEKEGEPSPTVAYEAGSNSLVISASSETQAALSGIISQLDVRRPQVLVEAIIVEISDTAASELGVQLILGGVDGANVPFFSTNFSQQPTNLLALSGAVVGDSLGLDESVSSGLQSSAVNSLLGLTGGSAGGIASSNDILFGAIVDAIETDENSNILSTPFVTTLDNAPARFVVGQEIPITIGQTLDATTSSVFTTFDRQEVGIKLDVLPQISEGDVIRLEITQEVSSIAGAVSTLDTDFILNTREIETTVLANDGEIIVLGGLIQDDEQFDVEKIPVLGDVPLLGGLFRAKSDSRVRTNLMVFLRPTIIRTAEDIRPLTAQRWNYLSGEDIAQTGRTISKLDSFYPEQSGNGLQDGLQNGGQSFTPSNGPSNGSLNGSSNRSGQIIYGGQ